MVKHLSVCYLALLMFTKFTHMMKKQLTTLYVRRVTWLVILVLLVFLGPTHVLPKNLL